MKIRHPTTLIELLVKQAQDQPHHQALIFEAFTGDLPIEITYADLDNKARAIAHWLQQRGARNERVMLLFPAGIDYVAEHDFFLCDIDWHRWGVR